MHFASPQIRITVKFQKGKSGNPGGRTKQDKQIKEVAQKYGLDCIKGLAELMRSDDPKVRLGAIKEMLDRGFGKASQQLEIGSLNNEPFRVIISEKKE